MLSIIVSWRDRTGLREPIGNLLEAARLLAGDLTLVNFGGDSALLRSELSEIDAPLRRALRVLHVREQRYFNKAAAQNSGALHSDAPALFFCDCDVVIAPGLLAELAARIAQRAGAFLTLAGVRESRRNARGAGHVISFGYQLRILTADQRKLEIVDHEENAEDGTRQAPGLLMVRRADFLAIDGYNSDLHGWGWEDQDMISRLTLGRGLERHSEGHALHLSHGDCERVRFYPEADRWASRDRMFRTALANYDRGDFAGSYARDAARLAQHAQLEQLC